MMIGLGAWFRHGTWRQGRRLNSEAIQRFDALDAAALVAGAPVKPVRASCPVIGVGLGAGWRFHGAQDRFGINFDDPEAMFRNAKAVHAIAIAESTVPAGCINSNMDPARSEMPLHF